MRWRGSKGTYVRCTARRRSRRCRTTPWGAPENKLTVSDYDRPTFWVISPPTMTNLFSGAPFACLCRVATRHHKGGGSAATYSLGRSTSMAATEQGTWIQHMGKTQGAENHDHDLIQDLSKRLDALWRYDQYIANAEGKPNLQECWRQLKKQEQENVKRLKELIAEEIRIGCF